LITLNYLPRAIICGRYSDMAHSTSGMNYVVIYYTSILDSMHKSVFIIITAAYSMILSYNLDTDKIN